MKNIVLILSILAFTSCSNESNEAEEFAAAFGDTLETVLGGKENVERLRAEQERKATPKPVWDTDTHDAIYELWTDSVMSTLLDASIDYDKLLGLKLSERTRLDEDRMTLSQFVRENHEDFLGALEVWPHLRALAVELLDAQEEKREREYAERVATNKKFAKKGPMYANFVSSAEELARETQVAQEKIDQRRSDVAALDTLLAKGSQVKGTLTR